MNLNLTATRRPEHLWLLAGALLLLLLLGWMALFVLTVHRNAAGRLGDIEPRQARIAGLLQSDKRLEQSAQALKANLADYVYAPDGDTGQIGNQALQRVRDIASARGLRVTSSQATNPREEQGFDHIGLSLRVEGEWPQLQSLIGELARQHPVIYTDTVQIGAQGAFIQQVNKGGQVRAPVVSAQFELYVLKERP